MLPASLVSSSKMSSKAFVCTDDSSPWHIIVCDTGRVVDRKVGYQVVTLSVELLSLSMHFHRQRSSC